MNDEKVNWLSLNSYSSTFPPALPKELIPKQEVKLHKKRKKKSKSNKKHKKKSKERIDSDFSSSSDSDFNDDNINLVDSIDSTYQEIIHLPNGDTIIKEKKLSLGDVSWKIDKQKEKEINQYDIPKYRLDTFGNIKSESKQLLRYYDDDHKSSNTTSNKSNLLKLILKNRIDSDNLNPFNYILYSNSMICDYNDRIEYIYKIMENVFTDVTNTSILVFYTEIINSTWHKSNQTFDTMVRIIKRALNTHPMSYDLYNIYFYISRSYFLSNNYCIDDIKQNYRKFSNDLLNSLDSNRSVTSSLALKWCKESILIDFYIINHSSILYNLSSTEHIIAYIQGLIEYNLLFPLDNINADETLSIFERYWDSEYLRIGETDRDSSSIAFWLNNNKPKYLPGNIFDYSELINMRANEISSIHQKYPLTFSVLPDKIIPSINEINDDLTKNHNQEVAEMNDEEDDNNVEYKLVYSTLHQQRIKVPIKSDSSMTYKQLLSKIDSGTINTKSSNRSNHYFIQATTNVQISEKNMKNFIIWQQYIISSLICYQPLRIHDHLSEYDDDFLNRTVIFEDIKNSLFLVQEDYSRIRLVIRSLQSLGICAYYSEDSNSIYHKHTINMNCSSDYIFNNWISYIESYVYHNNYTGVDNLDSLRNGSIDDILSRRILLSPIMFSSKLKRQYHTCKSGNNATQLTFIRRLLFGLIESPQLLYETKIELLSCILHLNSEIYMLSRGHVTFNAACHDELLKSNNESVIRKMEHFQKHMRVDVIDMTLWYDYILCSLYRGEDRVVSKYLDDLFYKIDTEYITAKDFSEILQLKGAIKLYHLAMYWVSTKNINKERQCKIIIILGNILINGGCGYYSRHLLSTYEEGNDDGEEEISIPNTFNIDKFNYFKQSIDEEINKYKRKLFEARAAHNIFYHNSFAQQTPSIVTKVDATLDIYYAINCFIFYFFYGNYSINLSSYEAVIHQIELMDKMYKAYIYSLINLYINKTHINGSNLHEIENILGSMKSQIEVSLLVTIERLFHARVLFLINIRVLLCPFVPDFLVGQSIFRSILDALNHFPSSTVFLSLRHCEESRHKSFKYDIKLNSNIGYVPTNAAILMNKLTTKIWSVAIIEKLRHDNNCIDHTLFANWSHESIEHLRKTIENLLVIEVAKQIPVVWLLYLTLEISIGNYKDARHIYYRALQSTSWSKDIWLFLYCLNRYSVFTDKEIDEFIHIMKLRGI